MIKDGLVLLTPPADAPVAYRAFESWLKANRYTVREVAALLFDYAKHGDMDNVAWFYLKRTGDTEYTPATFLKAARLALGMAPESEGA
jgi:hypothetical protein